MPGFLAWVGITLLTTAASILLRPRAKSAVKPQEVELPRIEPGSPIPVVFGTQKVAPHVVDITYVNRTPVHHRARIAGITVAKTRIGTNYYLSYVGVLCWGRLDALVDVIFDGRHTLSAMRRQPKVEFNGLTPIVTTEAPFTIDGLGGIDEQYRNLLPWGVGSAFDQFDGLVAVALNLPYLYGGETNGGGVVGTFYLYEGTDVQRPDPRYVLFTGQDQPAYGKLVYVYSHNVWHGEHPQPRAIEWVVRAFPEGLEGFQHLANWEGPDGGASPAAVLLLLLTSPEVGLGWPAALIDAHGTPSSFAGVHLAQRQLAGNEPRPFGISFTIRDRDQSIEQIIDEVCRTANLVLYQDPTSGLVKLREIYDEGTTAPLYTEADYDVLEWDRPLPGERTNQVIVVYSDRALGFQDNTVTAENAAAIERAGRVITETLEFRMVTTAERAAQVARRELRTRTAHLRSARLSFRRRASTLTPGARFRVPWPPTTPAAEATEFVTLRVLEQDWGTIADGRVQVEAIEDVFSLPAPDTTVTFPLPPTPGGTHPELGDVAGPVVLPVVTETATTGSVGLQILDPFGVVTRVEFRTQSGTSAPGAWTVDAAPPYEATVEKSVTASSVIHWRVTWTDASGASQTIEGSYTFPPRAPDAQEPITEEQDDGGFEIVTEDDGSILLDG